MDSNDKSAGLDFVDGFAANLAGFTAMLSGMQTRVPESGDTILNAAASLADKMTTPLSTFSAMTVKAREQVLPDPGNPDSLQGNAADSPDREGNSRQPGIQTPKTNINPQASSVIPQLFTCIGDLIQSSEAIPWGAITEKMALPRMLTDTVRNTEKNSQPLYELITTAAGGSLSTAEPANETAQQQINGNREILKNISETMFSIPGKGINADSVLDGASKPVEAISMIKEKAASFSKEKLTEINTSSVSDVLLSSLNKADSSSQGKSSYQSKDPFGLLENTRNSGRERSETGKSFLAPLAKGIDTSLLSHLINENPLSNLAIPGFSDNADFSGDLLTGRNSSEEKLIDVLRGDEKRSAASGLDEILNPSLGNLDPAFKELRQAGQEDTKKEENVIINIENLQVNAEEINSAMAFIDMLKKAGGY